jgi:hypothetical protein
MTFDASDIEELENESPLPTFSEIHPLQHGVVRFSFFSHLQYPAGLK